MTYRYADELHSAILTSGNKCIPVAPGNVDYEELMATNPTIEPYIEPPIIKTCTAVQGRLALKSFNILDQTEAVINSLPASDDIRIYWEYATIWRQDSEQIKSMGAGMGLSEQQIDDLFTLAQSF